MHSDMDSLENEGKYFNKREEKLPRDSYYFHLCNGEIVIYPLTCNFNLKKKHYEHFPVTYNIYSK
jgi:hypothetical protein